MPFLIWPALAGLAGVITGIVYEKETEQPIATSSSPSFSWWDKLLMAGCGVAAYYIYKKGK